MNEQKPPLTNAEWYVMECLWQHAPCTGREATEYLAAHAGWSRSTTLTMLRRMCEKALIACEEIDGIKSYIPLIRQEDATLQETQSFLSRVYHGSVSMMLSAFTQKQPLTDSEIQELYAILDKAKERGEHD